MPDWDDSALCCCEYINEDGQRSHLLATFCNCEAIDEGFESLYLVRGTSCAGFESPSKSGQEAYEDVIESGAWRICGQCERQVPRQASHCRTCDACYLLRDHHCVWLDVCVNHVNDRWFVSGLFSGALALCYGSHLTLTTLCHPRIINLYFTTMLFPHQCPNAFLDLQSSLIVSGACYGILLGTLVSVALTQQLVCIACGVRLREYRQRRQIPGSASVWNLKYLLQNSLNFWWR